MEGEKHGMEVDASEWRRGQVEVIGGGGHQGYGVTGIYYQWEKHNKW